MLLIEKVRSYLKNHTLFTPECTIVVGLSGGSDSVALLHILHTLGYRLIAAHLDHQWRPNSDEDRIFSEELAHSLQIPFFTKKAADISLVKKPQSKEEHGRLLRRAFLEEVAQNNLIALAHHADDQRETFFLRLIRGATVSGLSGMKPKNGQYVRPLLACSKNELLDYLKENAIRWKEDPTNTDLSFLRNAIRRTIIPACKSIDERFDSNCLKAITSLQETDEYLNRLTLKAFELVAVRSKDTFQLKKDLFLQQDPFLHYRLLVHWFCQENVPFSLSKNFLEEILRFMTNPAQVHTVHPQWQIQKKSGLLEIHHIS